MHVARIQCAFTRLHSLSFVYIHDGPHSVTLHTQFIHHHSLRSTFTFGPTRIQSEQHSTLISFMFIHVHTRTVTFTSNLIHGTFTGAAGARPPQPHTQRASFNRTHIQCSFVFIHHRPHSLAFKYHSESCMLSYHSDQLSFRHHSNTLKYIQMNAHLWGVQCAWGLGGMYLNESECSVGWMWLRGRMRLNAVRAVNEAESECVWKWMSYECMWM